MLSAFTAQPIIELKQRDKSKIESILSHSDQVLVGLNTGALRIYRIKGLAPRDSETDGGSDDHPQTTDDSTTTKPSELLREYEKFSKHKIEQLAVFREANILISLSNGLVSIHDIGTYQLLEQLTKTRGATTFAVTSNIEKDPATSIPTLVSRLAVAVKRRLLLWSWHDGELDGDATETPLSSSIKSLTWASGTKVLAGLTYSYVLVDIVSEEVKTIVGPGSIGGAPGQESSRLGGTMSYIGMGSMIPTPLATGLGRNEMLLARDINTHFIDRDGEPIGRRQIPWRTPPQAVGYSYPYLLALQDASKGILEVRNPQTLTLLQSIELPGAVLLQVPNPSISLAHQGKGFFVSSERMVWRMQGLNYDAQIDSLVESGSLDEAISLLDMIEETLIKNKAGRLREIKMQKAQKLFDEKRFRDALDLFAEVSAPPERVIKLYPELIAGDLVKGDREDTVESTVSSKSREASEKGQGKTDSSTTSPIDKAKALPSDEDNVSVKSAESGDNTGSEGLSEKELKIAVRELQAFLADVRRRLQRFFNPDQTVRTLSEVQSSAQSEDIRQVTEYLLGLPTLDDVDLGDKIQALARLVDTTLFRAHMYATPSLAGSLFRISNFCDPEVVMTKLEETERYNDLIEFLYGKRLHRQALERLQKFGQAEKTEDIDPELHGPGRTVSYLQNLGPELIDMILEFARWPVETEPEMAMEIFLGDTENAESLPRHRVLAFLESIDKQLAQRYLEHAIDEWNDLTPDLHQHLVSLYLEQLKDPACPNREELLDKFLTLLRTSEQYSPAKTLGLLPRDDPTFHEARAIVFSKMGNHKQALEIYVFKLHDPAKAEEYCNQIHLEETMQKNSQAPSRRKSTADPVDEQPSIYHVLLNLYLNPPKGENALWGPAIELMARHGPRLPASSTLELIPEDLTVKDLEFYFRGRMRNANSTMNDSMITAGLRKVEAVRVQAALLLGDGAPSGGRGRKVRIDEDRVCGVCYKRLGGSVISVFPE